MKNIILLISLLLFSSTSVLSQTQKKLTAQDILNNVDRLQMTVKDKSSKIEMVMIHLRSGKQKVKKAILYEKNPDKILFRYVYPKSVAGISFLSLPNHQVYIYLSLFKKAKRITNLANSGYNNSDFSFQDISSGSYSERFTPELIKTNDTAYVLKLLPKTKNPDYSYAVASINKAFFYPEQISYYDSRGKMIKQANYKYIKVNGTWVSQEVSMTDFTTKHQTKVIMSDIKVNKGLSNSIFTVQNLEGKH